MTEKSCLHYLEHIPILKWYCKPLLDKIGTMNRRNFFKIASVTTLASPIVSSANDIASLFPSNIVKVTHKNDIFLPKEEVKAFQGVRRKLAQTQDYVGYGKFNIITFDELITLPKWTSKLEYFTKEEMEFMHSIFYYDPKYHGFFGQRTAYKITEKIDTRHIKKIPYTGHYLFKGKTMDVFGKIKKDIGSTIVLTSGVRSVVKQMKLFLDKLDESNENLSIASRSLAPPGYTFHAIGDFDVGKRGYGYANFTEKFAKTDEFNKMTKLKYIDMRYTINNKDGVRYEPWHVKIV